MKEYIIGGLIGGIVAIIGMLAQMVFAPELNDMPEKLALYYGFILALAIACSLNVRTK